MPVVSEVVWKTFPPPTPQTRATKHQQGEQQPPPFLSVSDVPGTETPNSEFKGVKSNTTKPHFALTEIQDMGTISVAIFIDMEILRHEQSSSPPHECGTEGQRDRVSRHWARDPHGNESSGLKAPL